MNANSQAASASLRDWLIALIRRQLQDHPVPIELELEVAARLDAPRTPEATAELIETLIEASLREMPQGGELSVFAWNGQDTWEIEIADSGPSLEERQRVYPLVLAKVGARLQWRNCPQGGCAVTIIFRESNQRLRAA